MTTLQTSSVLLEGGKICRVLSLPSTMFPLTQNKPPLHAAPLHLGDCCSEFFSCNINVI